VFFNKTTITNVSLFVLALLLSSLMFDGLPVFLGDASYIDFNVSNSILSGHGFSTGPNIHGTFTPFGKRPPGFSLLVASLVYFGLPIMTASIIITSVSYALVPVFVFLIFKHYYNHVKALLAAFIVLFHPSLIYYSKIAAPEIIGILILSASYYLYLRWIENQYNDRKDYFIALLLGLILGLTIWFRYANAIYVVIFFSLIFFYALFHKGSRKSSSIALILGGSLSLFLLIRNYIYIGNFSGHPINNIKTNEMDVAVVKALNFLTDHQFGFDVNNGIIAMLFVVALMIMCLFIIIKAYDDKVYLFKVLPIALMPLAYLLFFSYVQSTTRVDDVSSRYLLPFYVSILMQTMFILYSLDYRNKFNTLFRSIVILGIVSYSYASYKVGSVDRIYNDRDYAPETINYILKSIDKGSVIIGSRYVGQFLMHSLDYKILGLRFYSSYNKDYGRKLSYGKKELVEKILKHNVKYLVIFTGKDKKENFINRGDYGEFIASLVETETDIVESKIELSDGIIITFKDKESLNFIHGYFKSEIPLVNKNNLTNGLNASSQLGDVTIADKGVNFSQVKVKKSSNLLLSFNAINSVYMASIKYTLPLEPLKMISISIRNENEFAHYFFNRNEIKFDGVSLRSDNIDRKSDNFSMNSINNMTIRLYPIDQGSSITDFQVNSVNFYTKK
jgi:hypothetical protein